MNMFNRREIFITRQLEALSSVTGKLTSNGVQYETKTNSITNPGRSHGIPFIEADSAYEYRVYVHKGDYECAMQALRT